MSRFLYQLARLAFRRRRLVLAVWLIAGIAAIALAQASGGKTNDAFTIPGTEAQHAADVLSAKLPAFSGGATTIVFASTGGTAKVTDPADPIASRLNALPKYVVSGSKRPLDWHNSHLVTGDVPAEIAKLKQLPGDELQVHGSGNLVHTLIRYGLADEYQLLVYPVILGTGKRLFPDGDIAAALRLTSSKTTGKGVQILIYEPAGPAQYGSFALEK